ncbi:hypothetical protein DBR06_SOUSAS14010147, partial [Sousa chinensis]
SLGYPCRKPAGMSHFYLVDKPLCLKPQREDPSLVCIESVLKIPEDSILMEEIFEETQAHTMVLPSKPQWCGSQEFWFGKTRQEEKSRLGKRPVYPNGESVENTTSNIPVIVKDETVSVEEISENTD